MPNKLTLRRRCCLPLARRTYHRRPNLEQLEHRAAPGTMLGMVPWLPFGDELGRMIRGPGRDESETLGFAGSPPSYGRGLSRFTSPDEVIPHRPLANNVRHDIC